MKKLNLAGRILSLIISLLLMISSVSGCKNKENDGKNADPDKISQSAEFHENVNNYFDYKETEAPGKISSVVKAGKAGDDFYVSGYSDINSLMSVNYKTVVVNRKTGEVTDCDLGSAGAVQLSNIFVSEDGSTLYAVYYDAGYNTILKAIETGTGKPGPEHNFGKDMLITSLRENNGKLELTGLLSKPDNSSAPFIAFIDRDTPKADDIVVVSDKLDLSWAGYTNVVASEKDGFYYAVMMSKEDSKLIKVIKFDSSFNSISESAEFSCGELYYAGLFENSEGNTGIILRNITENNCCIEMIDNSTGEFKKLSAFGQDETVNEILPFAPKTGADFFYTTQTGIYSYDTAGQKNEIVVDFENNKIPENCRNPYFINSYGDYFVLCGQGESQDGGPKYVFIDEDGNETAVVPVEYDNLTSVTAGKDRSVFYTKNENYGTDAESLVLVKADASGEIKKTEIKVQTSGAYYPSMITTLKDGSVAFIVSDSSTGNAFLQKYSSDCELIFDEKIDINDLVSITPVKDSLLMVCSMGCYIYDFEKKEKKETEIAGFDPYSCTVLESFDEKYDFYFKTSDGITGFDLKEKKAEETINWIDSDLSPNINSVLITNSDKMLVSVPSSGTENAFYLLTRADEKKLESIRNKEKLVIGIMNLTGNDDIINKVIEYNRSDEKLRVILNDYSKYGYGSHASENRGGMSILNSDLAEGKVPDIVLSYSDIDFSVLNEKNVFADINSFIEKDNDINRDDFIENIVDEYTENGKTYAFPVKFGIDVIMSSSTVLDSEKGWSMQDYIHAEETNDNFFSISSACDADMSLISSGLNEFVDFKNKKCSFDSSLFVNLINIFKKYNNAGYSENSKASICGIGDYLSYLYMFSNFHYNDPVIKGFPGKDKKGARINPQMILTISENSKNKEEAWNFAKYFISEEYQNKALTETVTYGFPVRRDTFERLMESEKEKDFTSYGITEDIKASEMAEMLKETVYSADTHVVSDSVIGKILREELDNFYSGRQTAEKTSEIIQKKVSDYLLKH